MNQFEVSRVLARGGLGGRGGYPGKMGKPGFLGRVALALVIVMAGVRVFLPSILTFLTFGNGASSNAEGKRGSVVSTGTM